MSLDIEELTGEAERLSQDNSEGFLENFVKMPEGNGAVVMRLLPPAAKGMFGRDKNPFYVATRVHRVNNKSLHCPKVLQDGKWKGECPICKYYNWLWQESEKKSPQEAEAMQNKARAIKPVERYYYNVIVRTETDKNGVVSKNVGPKILSVGKTLHKMIIRGIVGDPAMDEKPLGDVTHPKTGRDFKLVKEMRQSGKESYPNYSASKFLDVSPLGEAEQVTKWFAGLHDISALRVIKDEEELKKELKIHLGIIASENNGGFDPREFQKQEPDAQPTIQAEKTVAKGSKAAAPVEEEPAAEAKSEEEDAPLADDEFLSQLRAMQ